MRNPCRALVVLSCWCSSTGALAQTHIEPGSVRFTHCTREEYTGCLWGVSTPASNSASIRSSGADGARLVRDITDTAEDEVAALSGGRAVYAAGDSSGGRVQWWMSYSHADQDSDYINENNASLAYSGRTDSGLVGVHRLFGDRLLAGAAVGYEGQRTRTFFNGGFAESEGPMLMPYVAYLIGEHFSIDAGAGVAFLDYSQSRISPGSGVMVLSDFESKRWFFSTNLAGFTDHAGFSLGGTVGFLYVEENQDAYNEVGPAPGTPNLWAVGERTTRLSQLILGFDVAYPLKIVEPYGYVNYRNDLSSSQDLGVGGLLPGLGSVSTDDDDEVELGLGFRFRSNDSALSGSIEGSYTAGRSDFDGWAVTLTGRYDY